MEIISKFLDVEVLLSPTVYEKLKDFAEEKINILIEKIKENLERSGLLVDNLNKIAKIIEKEIIAFPTDTLLGLLEPTLIVIVGISIGFIVTAIMLPMFSMSMIQ